MFKELFNNVNLEESELFTPEELEQQLNTEASEDRDEKEKKPDPAQDEPDPSGMLSPKELEEAGLLSPDTESGPDSTESEQQESGKYLALLNALIEKRGVNKEELFEKVGITNEDLKDDPEAVLELLDKIYYTDAQEIADDYIKNNLTDYQQKFIDLVEEGVSEQVAASIIKDYKAVNDITEDQIRNSEDSSIAKAIYKKFLKETTKFSDARIDSEIEKKHELGLLDDDAVDCLSELKEIVQKKEQEELDKVKESEEARKKQTLESAEKLQKLLEDTNEIAGLKLTKELKNKWKKQYEPVEVNVNGEKKIVSPLAAIQMKNPTEFDALLKFYNAVGMFNFDGRTGRFSPDFKVLKSLGKNEAVQNLVTTIENEQKKNLNRTNNMRSGEDSQHDEGVKGMAEDFAKILGITNKK